MKSFTKTAIASLAVLATTLASMPTANAGERWRRYDRHYHGHSDGDLAVAGLLGLATGALIAGLASRPAYGAPVYRAPVYDEPIYAEPRPLPYRGYRTGYVGRQVIHVDDYGSLEPWTPQWYAYCSDRYRSFNERTGNFTGYDGRQHFCVAR
jgi:hypothetical protein